MEFEEVKRVVKKFTEERNWNQFHTPDNLAKSIVTNGSHPDKDAPVFL